MVLRYNSVALVEMSVGGDFLHVFSTFYVVLLVWFGLPETRSQETKGQKAHFSLTDTPGSFTAHATKILAKVSSQADSVNVVIEPGMAQYPLLQSPTTKPLVHVIAPAIVRPQGGWNYFNLVGKRSRINGQKTSEEEKRSSFGIQKLQIAHVNDDLYGKKREFNKNDYEVSNATPRFTKFGLTGFKDENSSGTLNTKSRRKRSGNERKMVFSGGTGQFSVHVDQNETKVLTSTGKLQVFIKNPSTPNNELRSGFQQSARMDIFNGNGETPNSYK